MKAVQDFNYKVALASGLKHLRAGKLRQAEEQFRYLVSRFPRADGGYRGLARVQVEVQDRAAAVVTLRDGAAALARSGDREVAIDLLREATALDPSDLASHRRLAAALALAGDAGGAAEEHVRFVKARLDVGDLDRARLEATYALETLGEIPALEELALAHLEAVRHEVPAPPRPAAAPPPGPAAPPPATPPPPPPPAVDAISLDARAAELIAAHDPSAGPAAIEASRALLESGKTDAASDLLLQLVASGIALHDAERALIEVTRATGRSELADERQRLLGEAQRLG